MRCLVVGGKHVSDIRAVARQPPITTIEKLLEAVFGVGSSLRLYSEDPRPAELFSVVGYSRDSNNVSTEAGESSLLRSVTRDRLVTAN
jgi:hypothetical protein